MANERVLPQWWPAAKADPLTDSKLKNVAAEPLETALGRLLVPIIRHECGVERDEPFPLEVLPLDVDLKLNPLRYL